MTVAEEAAEILKDDLFAARVNVPERSGHDKHTQYVDVETEFYGDTSKRLLEEKNIIITRVDSGIDGTFDGAGTRYWFNRVGVGMDE